MQNPFEAFKITNEADYEQFAVHAKQTATPLFLSLSPLHQSRALKFAETLTISSFEEVIHFGQNTQQSLKNFSSEMLHQIQKKDSGNVRNVLHDLMRHLEKIDPDALVEEERGLLKRFFSRPKQSVQEVMTIYNKISRHIDRLGIQLTHTQTSLLADLHVLETLYTQNEDYFHEINIYIASLEIKKQYVVEQIIPALQQATDPLMQQRLQDVHMQLEWLDRRMYDLELSREISIQYAPQIRLIQQTNHLLIDKIQTSILTTIPLWQSQIAMLLNLNKQRRAIQNEERMLAVREQMQKKTTAAIEQTSTTARKQIASLKETQQRLLGDIHETLTLEQVTAEKRSTAEQAILDKH